MKKWKYQKIEITTKHKTYTMCVDLNTNHTTIMNSKGNQIAKNGFQCLRWLLRNKIHALSLWNGNHLEGTLCLA